MPNENSGSRGRGYDPADREAEIAQKLLSLQSKSPRIRAESAKRLGELRAGVEALLGALNDSSSLVRAAAAEALGFSAAELGAGGAVEGDLLAEVEDGLLAAIDDSNDYVCSSAIHSLGRLRSEPARAEILTCLDDHNPHIVEAAIIALARLGPPEMAERLAGFLDSQNDYLLSAAARAVALLGYAPAGPKLLANLEHALAHTGGRRNEFLLGSYVQALARLQVHQAVPVLTRIAQTQVGLRSKAVQALIDLGAEEAAPVLVGMFADPGTRLRLNLLRLVVQANYRPALPAIRPLLQDTSAPVRQAALEAILRLKDEASTPTVRQMALQDPNPYLRVQAVNSLPALFGQDAAPDLLALLFDANSYVRLAAVRALGDFPGLAGEDLAAAQAALDRLAASDLVPEVAEAARQVRALEQFAQAAPGGAAPASMAPSSLLPQTLRQDGAALLELLERWQAGLGEIVSAHDPERVTAVDEALTTLIRAIQRSH